jgi:hypothetical protein
LTLPRVLVVGGAGTFGGLLAEGLAATVPCTVVIAGRDARRSAAAAAALAARHPGSRIEAVSLDAVRVGAEELGRLGLSAVADAAGPFQETGYNLAQACIAARLPYVDIADARGFVAGFPALDGRARAAGVAALCGASSTPALSNAALDALAADWTAVETVAVAISPGNRAPRGLSVFQSILGYAGRPVDVLVDGRRTLAPGWGLSVSEDMPELGRRRLSLCDTPDLDLMPARHPEARTVLFRAGLELGALHLGLSMASLPVRWGFLPSLRPFARPVRALAALFEPFGGDRGGMTVRAAGRDADGRPVSATWFLVAEAGDGPYVPTLPALAVLRSVLAGPGFPPGARACAGELALADIEHEMRRHRIRTGIVREGALRDGALAPTGSGNEGDERDAA